LSAPSATPMTLSEHSTQKVSTGGSSMNSGRALTLRMYACSAQWTAGYAVGSGAGSGQRSRQPQLWGALLS
jgi:hypothetical protein